MHRENEKRLTNKQVKKKYKEAVRKMEDFEGKEQKGSLNCYTCDVCGHIDKYYYADAGVTPFVTSCGKCNGMSKSSMGGDIVPQMAPTQEWYRPSILQTQFMQDKYPAMFQHVLNGGLQPRPIDYSKYDAPVALKDLLIGMDVYHIMFGPCTVTHPVSQEMGKVLVNLHADEISYLVEGIREKYCRSPKGDHILYTPINQLFLAYPLNPPPYLVSKKEKMQPQFSKWDNHKKQ